MSPWLGTAGVILVALCGVVIGKLCSRFRKPYWTMGYFLPSIPIALLILARFKTELLFVPPVSWMATGRIRFIVLALAVTISVTTPLSRLPRRHEKVLMCILMGAVVAWFSVMPFLVPALIKEHLRNIGTLLDSNGVCYQTTSYTCAPAAAVTALGKLGLSASEGEIAVLSYTSPVTGTLPGCLSSALQARYRDEGIKCQYRHFDSVGQLRDAGLTLAVVRDTFLSNHCVAVLEVSEDTVTLADPIDGKRVISHEQFEKMWRFSGVVLRRESGRSVESHI